MQKTIVWNNSALSDYHDNIDYLLREWSEAEAIHFMDDVENILFLIGKGLMLFKESGYKDIRQCVINKHITLYYIEMPGNKVELLRFWNNHKDETNLSF